MPLSTQDQNVLQSVYATLAREHQPRFDGSRTPAVRGQFVAVSLSMDPRPERYIGFVVQIRKKAGQFGSDKVFLRHADGGLIVHENQSFYLLTPEQEARVRSVYVKGSLPEDEDYEHGYDCCAKVFEKGFIVENSASPPALVQPMQITVSHGDGSSENIVLL